MNIRQRLALWLDPTPERINRVHNEILLKSARRCAHDLDHCASDIYWCAMRKDEQNASDQADFYHHRANEWRKLFYPDDGVKSYRIQIEADLERLRNTMSKYKTLLLKHGLVDPWDDDIPF